MGSDNHVVSHKLCGFQGHVDRHVVMKEQAVVAPKFWSFSSHIFSQASQNVTVKVRVDRSVRRNRFTANNPLHAEKEAMSMLFVELWTCLSFLALGDYVFFHSSYCCFVSAS
jgi:hypothetical protein